MEDKKLPQSETDEQNINGAVPDDDEYFSLEDVSDEVSDDDLDLSELIRKYMPDRGGSSRTVIRCAFRRNFG